MEYFENNIKELLLLDVKPNHKRIIERCCRFLVKFYNKLENEKKVLASKETIMPSGLYADNLIYFGNLMALHGHNELEMGAIFRDDFVNWFLTETRKTPQYNGSRITKELLKAFAESYILFKFEFDRKPEDYKELRDFVLNWEDVITEREKEEIKNLTNEL